MTGTSINVDDLVAIDVHTHAEVSADGHLALAPAAQRLGRLLRRAGDRAPTSATWRRTTATGRWRPSSSPSMRRPRPAIRGSPTRRSRRSCAEHADVLIPFASVDPWKGKMAARGGPTARRGSRGAGVQVPPEHRRRSTRTTERPTRLYEPIQEYGIPALFHSGQTGIGAGVPGGGGIRLKYSNPMLLDDVAVDFPDLTIIIAHPSFPWQDEALASPRTSRTSTSTCRAGHRSTSRRSWCSYANSLLQDKVLFGSDYPVLTPDRWLADFDTLDIKPRPCARRS